MRFLPRHVAAVLTAVALVTGCGGADDPRAQPTPSLPLPTLPAGDLNDRVLQPAEVSRNLVPIAANTGTRDIKAVSAFYADAKAAEKQLQKNGFQASYVVQYADPSTNAVVTNVVTKFATAAGAKGDLTADLTSARKTGAVFPVTGLGDEAGGVRSKRDKNSPEGSLVTLRWRSGDTTWLLAVSASTLVAQDGVRKLADQLMTRLSKEA
ncbi:MAG TPA: hypothetical protein VNA20_18215 [Frankiaceae bacterium]|nr:hypothetical protein [Frankiaceae bacterium]